MARASRNAIEQFAATTQKPFPEGIVDLNNNDNFIPKEEIMSEWTAMPVKNKDETFSLRFAYELNTKPGQPEPWVQLRNWELESVEGQSEHVVVDLKNKSDHVNILLHYLKAFFSLLYAYMHSSQDTKPFNLDAHFAEYKLSAYWTSKRLTALALNISKYNNVITQNKRKNPKKIGAICWWLKKCPSTCSIS